MILPLILSPWIHILRKKYLCEVNAFLAILQKALVYKEGRCGDVKSAQKKPSERSDIVSAYVNASIKIYSSYRSFHTLQ